MHEKNPLLSASKRERLGSRYAQRARAAGHLPAVVYGHGQAPLAVNLPAKETLNHIHKGEKVFTMAIAGEDQTLVLLKDIQFDYLGTNIVHADFARVDLNERIHTRVHINLVGEAVGLKTAGAILMHPTTEIEIECRVTELPDSIEVSITDLDVGHAITAGDVTLPGSGMKLITDVHAILAQIVIQKEEVITAEAAAVAAEAAQPEVITAKKPEEGAPAAGDKAKAGDKGKAGGSGGDKKK
ncbi:MAG: 50S ribosomal protein L25 [Phycisphaerales bacterium]|nr:50S ribosomal protein L25 [Phycisphaerales bacterium]